MHPIPIKHFFFLLLLLLLPTCSADGPQRFAGVQKNTVIQDAQMFSDSQVREGACVKTLTNLLHLITRGEKFTDEESTELFFACTKLFQTQNVLLRRLVFLAVKELDVSLDVSFIATSTMLKEVCGKVDLFRGHATRILARIISPSMVANVERYLQQCVVDRDDFIVISALATGHHLWQTNPDVIKRWSNELQEAFSSHVPAQFLAMNLYYKTKAHDKIGLSKAITSFAVTEPHSVLARIQQVRIVSKVVASEAQPRPELMNFLNNALQDPQFPVAYEAARGLCALPSINHVRAAIPVLTDLLRLALPTPRLAALRTLSDIVAKHPSLLTSLTGDLENLIMDPNRSVATLAVTTLLKMGSESSVDRLIKSLSGIMGDVSEDFKVVLVEAVQDLGMKFPDKHATLLNFLLNVIREEGGFAFKRAVAHCMITIATSHPNTMEHGLDVLSELVEDIDYPEVAIHVINTLSQLGPRLPNPYRYVRHIYNRLVLESSPVRGAAVHALARFGAHVPSLTKTVVYLLQSCLSDSDDETRERSDFYIRLFEKGVEHVKTATAIDATALSTVALLSQTPTSPASSTNAAGIASPSSSSLTPNASSSSSSQSFTPSSPSAESPLGPAININSLRDLEFSLLSYLDKGVNTSTPFDVKTHFIQAPPEVRPVDPSAAAAAGSSVAASSPTAGLAGTPAAAGGSAVSRLLASPSAAVAQDPATVGGSVVLELPSSAPAMGTLWRSSSSLLLTESETEYLVAVSKHVFDQAIVFQFAVGNSLPSTTLKDVSVEMDVPADWEPFFSIPEAKIDSYGKGTCIAAFVRPKNVFATGPIACRLMFTTVDEDGGEDQDDYQLESVALSEADFMRPPVQGCGMIRFKEIWDTIGDSNEVVRRLNLGCSSLQEAVDLVIDRLGMGPSEGVPKVPEGANTFMTTLHGSFLGGVEVYCRAGFMLDQKDKSVVGVKFGIRSQSGEIAKIMANAVR